MGEVELVDLDEGKIVNKKWVVDGKLGEGCCGTVYRVHDIGNNKIRAALKVEARSPDSPDILRKEVAVMTKLQTRQHTVQVVHAARRELYSYVVMTLYGLNLQQLKKKSGLEFFTAGTVSRIAIHSLYGIKQLHEIGYVHRDIKPTNLVIGRGRIDSRVVFLIDYGMARAFALWSHGVAKIRRQREHVLFRGTTRYCSPTVHARREQGRKDDLWSMMYMLVELCAGLPWKGMKEDEIGEMKNRLDDEVLMTNCPPEWIEIMKHIRSLSYESRPDYKQVYDQLIKTLRRLNVTFDDPYDWENPAQAVCSSQISHADTKSSKSQSTSSAPQIECRYPTTESAQFESNDIGV